MEAEKKLKEKISKIPSEVINNLRHNLLARWSATHKPVIIFPKYKRKSFPFYYFFGILSYEVKGLSDSLHTVITEIGWHLSTSWEMSIDVKKAKLKMVIFGLEINNTKELNEILKKKREAIEKLLKVCAYDETRVAIIESNAKKIIKYEETLRLLRKHKEFKEEMINLLTAFFDVIEKEYVIECEAKELVDIILTYYKFIQNVISTGKKQIKSKQIRRKKLTELHIACLEHEISLNQILSILSEYKIHYNRHLFTRNGVAVYIIQIEGLHLVNKFINLFNGVIPSKMILKVDFERYVKTVIPKLLSEIKATGLPQLFISQEYASPTTLKFRVIIGRLKGKPFFHKFISKFSHLRGFNLTGFDGPNTFDDVEIYLCEVNIDPTIFYDATFIYDLIKKQVESEIGELRDFSEGMREIDNKRLSKLQGAFKDININLLTQIYYGIEDFWRITATEDEIFSIIELSTNLIKKDKAGIEISNIDDYFICAILSFSDKLTEIIKILREYNPSISKIELTNKYLILVKLKEKITKKLEENIKHKLLKII